uniref:Uncharacterized protein n=1 Tax=Candidatus Phytoplasma australasiaticum subsp. australasiaticum TaxID=2832407 RepID=A0A7S7JLM9_9MOLU|nr:hypothetical protein H7685_02410 ['Parthenium hysterophorus' phyllody phytoplasma]
MSYQYEQKHLYEDSQDTNISNHFILPVNLFWSSLVNQLINKKLTEAELIDNLHEAFYNIDISNNNKYQYLFREINLYKNNLVLLDPNFISNIMLIINQIPIHNLNQLFQYIIEEHQKQKNSTNKKILNLDFLII